MKQAIVAIAVWAAGIGAALAAEPGAKLPDYGFLRGSAWYVPPATLPAAVLDPSTGAVKPLVDQTVWEITHYRDGYFWGRTVVQLTNPASGMPTGNPACFTMIGSVTPTGDVQMTFIQQGQTSTLGAARGAGTLSQSRGGDWKFQMQMSSGTTSLVVHWSYMVQCKAGQPCQAKLPGSSLGLSAFLAQCPAS
jgi:hypothetical protein